jgi:hypothetical protein
MLLVRVLTQLVLGDAAGNIAHAACLIGAIFCLAHAFNVIWPM